MEKLKQKIFSKDYDKYDNEFEKQSLLGKCIFCRISTGKSNKLLYEVKIFMRKIL